MHEGSKDSIVICVGHGCGLRTSSSSSRASSLFRALLTAFLSRLPLNTLLTPNDARRSVITPLPSSSPSLFTCDSIVGLKTEQPLPLLPLPLLPTFFFRVIGAGDTLILSPAVPVCPPASEKSRSSDLNDKPRLCKKDIGKTAVMAVS